MPPVSKVIISPDVAGANATIHHKPSGFTEADLVGVLGEFTTSGEEFDTEILPDIQVFLENEQPSFSFTSKEWVITLRKGELV